MKITEKTSINKIKYSDIKVGEVFRYDYNYYVAIELVDNRHGYIYNCVNLATGDLHYCCDGLLVEGVKTELIIE